MPPPLKQNSRNAFWTTNKNAKKYFLAGLLADTAQGANVLGLLCSVSTGYSVLDSLVNVFYDTSVAGLSCDTMVSMLQDSSISAWALANSLVNIMQLDSPAISQYMELIGIDTALYTDSAIRPFMQASVQYALAGYGSNSRILTFFNNYTGTSNILSEISSPTQLMTIAYNANPAGFLDTFASVVGVAYIDSAIATIPGLGLLPYAYEACGALGVSVGSISLSMESLVSHQFGLAEHDFYGSSRLGIKNYYGDEVGFTWSYPNTWADTVRLWKPVPWYSLEYQDVIKTDSTNLYGNTFTDLYTTEHVLGKKQYELTDHLGDVLATVSDKRANDSLTTYGGSTGSPDTVRTWKPVVVAAYDYYPFGEYMPTRYTNDSTTHCYTATLPELVHSIFYTPWTIWPLYTGGGIVLVGGGGTTATLSGTTDMALTTTAVGGGFSYDLTGLYSGFSASMTISLSAISGSFTATLTDDSTGAMIGSTNVYNTQGNTIVYSVPFTAASRSATLTFLSTSGSGGGTFTGFGDPHDTMLLENVVTLVCDEEWYRYGHNGQMKNNQWAGLGNHYEFKAREYDPRTGKFISVDPLFAKYPGNASYNFAQDRVIDGKDLEGKEYLPGNPAADFVFDIVVNKLVGGAAQFKAGVDNVVAARSYQENGNGGGASPQNIPTGAGAQMYAKTQEADGWTNIAEGASKVYVGTAELTLATYGAAEDVAAADILGLKFGVNAGESIEPGAVGFGQTNQPEITISRSKYPEAAQHVDEAQAAGKPSEGIVDRASADSRRKEAIKGIETKKGMDRDEYPPAVLKTNSKASVKHITSSDNRGAGSSMGHQLKNVPNGTKVTIKTGP